ncbi:MAG: bile acid:sodium symporter family protein [Saprospiraceae bacterium]|jgi:BASS family bile acid:Na+ symporter|nr:bile acid:sodium symporter family protein [Saprospiraceae bacterium]MBK6479903.1 bile acid:sodium symporter family protein [Saprospiraceae bacterium]MBK6815239.1 bile acid:sodium symporter family protein [Saprospiraceae bacterium]MBK7372276.1 bile acid:sodium symporter family protein [Saprospiraceae bacterium]MBK7435260.1 bile acid:sodium symporter family protein [Saprospiraceae bacterium]
MKNYTYTIFIILAVIVAYFFPGLFIEAGGIKLTTLIMPMLQVIMFGMGTTMSADDFKGVIQNPKGVLVGLMCQFAIMPFLGFGIAKMFNFPPEIAAGIILIGSSPSGLASNVMAYIAKANVALSITITSCATLLAPFLTPFFMKFLGGGYINIDVWKMMWDITKIVILPILLGVGINALLPALSKRLQKVLPLISMAGIGFVIVTVTAAGHESLATVGGLLLVAVLLHNLGGFVIGYFSSKLLFKLPEQDCRTVAIEVGLQNGGLASALAVQMGKIATVGLASALFGPLMNITGSLLASFWATRPVNSK